MCNKTIIQYETNEIELILARGGIIDGSSEQISAMNICPPDRANLSIHWSSGKIKYTILHDNTNNSDWQMTLDHA